MNRADLLLMTDERLADAQVLWAGERWAFAYYVAGYAVECALKACVLSRMVHTGLVFERKLPEFRTHKLNDLIEIAGLRTELNARQSDGTGFAVNWDRVVKWTEESRYSDRSESEAEKLLAAITEPTDGVLAWLRPFM